MLTKNLNSQAFIFEFLDGDWESVFLKVSLQRARIERVVEYLTSMHEALGSISNTKNKEFQLIPMVSKVCENTGLLYEFSHQKASCKPGLGQGCGSALSACLAYQSPGFDPQFRKGPGGWMLSEIFQDLKAPGSYSSSMSQGNPSPGAKCAAVFPAELVLPKSTIL